MQAQVANDLLAEEAVDVGGGGDLEAGEGFLSDARPADDVAAFEDGLLPTGPRQVAGRHQAVMARADDNRLALAAHVCLA